MLALYFPILLYAVSTFDVSEDTYAVTDYEAKAVGEPTVVLGQSFQARTFLAATRLTTAEGNSEKLRPELIPQGDLLAQGDSLLVMDTDGLLGPEMDQTDVSFEAQYEVQQLGGATQRFPLSGSFTVRRPEIVARSETAQALYRRTLNRVRLSVPGLPNQSLRVVGPGGAASGTTIELSPTGEQETVDVYLQRSGSEDVRLGQREFAVIDPPRPQIRVFTPQGEVTSGDALNRRRAVLRFEIEPDQEFQGRYPEDAQYRANAATVYLRRGQMASQELGEFSLDADGQITLTQELQGAEPGDQITVRLQSVVRINHQGERIEVPLRESSRTFGLVLS